MIPAFNAESTIRAAVESALQQTRPALEVIVADDASTDGTIGVLDGISDPRLRVLRSSENRGPAVARNSAMAVARGDLIACLDADDMATPYRLALQVPVFQGDGRAVLVCGSALTRAEDGSQALHNRSASDPGSMAWALRFWNPIVTSTATFRRAAAQETGGFPPRFTPSEDHALWLALARRGGIVRLADILANRTILKGGLSESRSGEQERMSTQACIEAIAELTGRDPSEAAYRVLRCGAAPDQTTAPVLEEAAATWCAVFDAVQRELMFATHRRAAARASLNELRRLMRTSPDRRCELLRQAVGQRRLGFAGAVPSVAFLRLMRTMVEGR